MRGSGAAIVKPTAQTCPRRRAIMTCSDERFSSPEVERILGIKQKQFQQWRDGHFFYSTIQRAEERHGFGFKWTRGDIHQIATFKWLIRFGLRRSVAALWAKALTGSANFVRIGALAEKQPLIEWPGLEFRLKGLDLVIDEVAETRQRRRTQ
jgi:hypothetical protein